MVKRGIELGCLAIIDVKQNTAYHFDAVQTPRVNKDDDQIKLVNHYCNILADRIDILKKHSSILVVDGWFNKQKFIKVMTEHGLEVICRLRPDANLRYLYNGPKKATRGRPKKYSGKINLQKIDKRVFKKSYQDDEKIIYEAVVYSVCLKISNYSGVKKYI